MNRVELSLLLGAVVVLAAVLVPAISGAMTAARGPARDSDIAGVAGSVARYVSDHGVLPTVEGHLPSKSVADVDDDRIIKVNVNSRAPDLAGVPQVDVTCGDGAESMRAALAECFAPLDFGGKLVPDYVRSAPRYATGRVTATMDSDGSTADLRIDNVDGEGTALELYLDADIAAEDELRVWSVDRSGTVFVL